MVAQRILVTGANGEIGHSLVRALSQNNSSEGAECEVLVGLDRTACHEKSSLQAADHAVRDHAVRDHAVRDHAVRDHAVRDHAVRDHAVRDHAVRQEPQVRYVQGDLLDTELVTKLFETYRFTTVFHLAAILSTGGEREPWRAHEVNVQGSYLLLKLAQEQSIRSGRPVIFVFPSTIAVYGLPSLDAKRSYPRIKENQFLSPITMYGINKLYVENMGTYLSNPHRLLTGDTTAIDFRAVRFPGLLSADTVPSGGTSDYGPQMLHAAAQGVPYSCFVGPEARLPFMAMPDAERCLREIARADAATLKSRVYNVGSFSISAREIREIAIEAFPGASLDYKLDSGRGKIVDSWPEDVDDQAARQDWGWAPGLSAARTFSEYLIPRIRERYRSFGGSACAAAAC